MNFITLRAKSYEDAVLKAEKQYGKNLRIFSKKDIKTKSLFKKQSYCEITFYLVNNSTEKESLVTKEDLKEFEKEAKTPNPSVSLNEEQEKHIRKLLLDNDFTDFFIDKLIEKIKTSCKCEDYSLKDLEATVFDVLINLIKFDYTTQVEPKKNFVILGPTGVGKTTTLAKIAALFSKNRKVSITTIDTFRVGAYEQIKSFADKMNISVGKAETEKELYYQTMINSDKDIHLIDTMGKSPSDVNLELFMKKMLSTLDKDNTSSYLTLSASMKTKDINSSFKRFKTYNIKSLIVTKLDESETIGNIISFSYENDIPLLFFTNGQVVPQDIQEANSTSLLRLIKGSKLDLNKPFSNQFDRSKF